MTPLRPNELQLPVRAGNVVAKLGVTTVEEFMDLTEGVVRTMPGAGDATWRSIREAQRRIRTKAQRSSAVDLALQYIELLNDLSDILDDEGVFVVRNMRNGELELVRRVEVE